LPTQAIDLWTLIDALANLNLKYIIFVAISVRYDADLRDVSILSTAINFRLR